MKIIIQTVQQLQTFVNPAELLSNQKIRIAAIATAAFTVLGAFLSISYCLYNKKFKNRALPPNPNSPILDQKDLKESPQTQKQSESSIKELNDLTGNLAIVVDSLKSEAEQTKYDLKDLQQELSDLRDMTLDYDKRLKALESQNQAVGPVLPTAAQAQNAKDTLIQTFNDKHCVLEGTVRSLFPKGIKMDDFFVEEFQQIVNRYPNIRFYFTHVIGSRPSINPDDFSHAVTEGPDDAIWCIASLFMGHNKIDTINSTFQNQKVTPQRGFPSTSEITTFHWSIGLPMMCDPSDRSINKNDNVHNQDTFNNMLAALQDEKKRRAAMDSVKAFKG